MVINTSHSEYMANRLPNEKHLDKIKSCINSANPRDKVVGDKMSTVDKTDEKMSTVEMQSTKGGAAHGDGFTKKKFALVKHDESPSSAGLEKLKEMMKNSTSNGICNSNDFDYLLWKDEPKELALSVNFAQMLNFKNVSASLNVIITTILETESSGTKTCRFSRVLEYPIYRSKDAVINMIPSALNKEGPKGDMVKLISQNNHAIGLSDSVASKAVGVEMSLLSGRSVTKMNAIRCKPVDMRQMALKAVMLKLQLSLMYALDDDEVEVETVPIDVLIEPKSATEALRDFPAKDVIIDVANLSDMQKNILAVLCSRWPSQRLVSDDGLDIYSALTIEAENFQLYTSHNEGESLNVVGLLMHPKTFWAQCVQLFMNLGGLDDLVTVVRDSRGLAPIMVHNCKSYGKMISVVSAYPMSTCYHGLDVNSVPNRKYVAPTILESSTLVLLVDNMMLSLYLNNLLYMTENLGLGSRTLFPNVEGNANNKALDVLACYNLTSGLPTCELMDLTCPWLGRMGRFQSGGVAALMDMVNKVRNRQAHRLVYCPLNYRIPTKMRVSSVNLMRGSQEIDVAKIMGFHSSTDVTGSTIQLMNWYNAVSGDMLPCFGPSAHGSKLRGDELPMLRRIHKYKGVYKIVRVIAITDYIPQKTGESTLKQTFFQNPGYMEAEGVIKVAVKPIEYKPNSFNLAGVPSAPRLGRSVAPEKSASTLGSGLNLSSLIELTRASDKGQPPATAEQVLDFLQTIDRVTREKQAEKGTPGAADGVDLTACYEAIMAIMKEKMNRENGATPRSSMGSGSSDATVVHQGVCQMLSIPESEPFDVIGSTKPGNCAIEALGALIPGLNMEEALGKMGVSLHDGFWLAADELAKIADQYDKNLLVMKDKGPPEFYCGEGKEERPVAIVHQSDNHFRPARPKATNVSRQVLKIALEPATTTEQGRTLSRMAIEKGQKGRSDRVVIP